MLWFYEHLEFFVLGLFASGVTLHFAMRRLERQRYMVLRAAYEDAVRDSRESNGDPAAVVGEAELQRAFMNSWLPGWFDGLGRCLGRWLKYCAAFTLVALFFRGPILKGEEDYAKRQDRAAAATRVARSRVPGNTPADR